MWVLKMDLPRTKAEVKGLMCCCLCVMLVSAVPRHAKFFATCLRHSLLSRTRRSCDAIFKRTIMDSQVKSPVFDLSNYNCIGFDLDNTICRYKTTNLAILEYEALSKYLTSQKNYSAEALLRPIDFDFLQRGLFLDFDKGNILRVTETGYVWKASHGTRPLSEAEIVAAYGKDRIWDVATTFGKDPLATWNGPLSEKMRSLLDYFDMPSSLIFARIIDDIDKRNGGPLKEPYKIWPDILDGLVYMFDKSNFVSDDPSNYFGSLQGNPSKYVNPCSPEAIEWLRKLKESNKVSFLITGSHIDFASFTATNCLGPNWRDLFDIVISFARKPFFFLGNRPFLQLNGAVEGDPITDVSTLTQDFVSVSQGNWQELQQILRSRLGGADPHCLYIGDNVVQDLVAPAQHTSCHTLALTEELWAEDGDHPDKALLVSKFWGSYFGTAEIPSLWHSFMIKNSQLIVPNFDTITSIPLNEPVPVGYYPKPPNSLQK
ncbi:hypothetical protein B566_EDAN006015 [Ephemera danica]|nr:hypothetical protein B566_EDAN006015 [Ephemera danica]